MYLDYSANIHSLRLLIWTQGGSQEIILEMNSSVIDITKKGPWLLHMPLFVSFGGQGHKGLISEKEYKRKHILPIQHSLYFSQEDALHIVQ